MSVHLFGIRHHGPGSARSLNRALHELQPDRLLLEGPADGEPAIAYVAAPDFAPPVALLLHATDGPEAAYYPFATFSPEWQALQYAVQHDIPVQFMDLPQTSAIASERAAGAAEESDADPEAIAAATATPELEAWLEIRRDPLSWLARAAGYPDGEAWWELLVEQRADSRDLFAAIRDLMATLRAEVEQQRPAALPPDLARRDRRETLREAYMRQTLRRARKQSARLAVVCGAWHLPALSDPLPPAKGDRELLKGLPKAKVAATWIPWTYRRLSAASGYGAGIRAPGWYAHLWECPEETGLRWLARIAQLLRAEDLDASPAQVVDAARLADTLAALRDRPRPGLDDLTEAACAVLCHGDSAPVELVWDRLTVGDRLGSVPDSVPAVPLQRDLQQWQKRLRLKPAADPKELVLDLREERDRDKSRLLHRLRLLDLPWGKPQQVSTTGTFKEAWVLQWHPEFSVQLIEAGAWGNTVAAAAAARSLARPTPQLADLTDLLSRVLLADLPDAIARLLDRLRDLAARSDDTPQLLAALPPLANIARYGDVRQTDREAIARVTSGTVARICIGLPAACHSLDDDAAADLDSRIAAANSALRLLDNDAYLRDWQQTLRALTERETLHGLLAGRCCRLLLDGGAIAAPEAARQLSSALSRGGEVERAAAWVEGFLAGSGLLLLYDDDLWQIVDTWANFLSEADFIATLPLLRRTFSTFAPAERRQLLERLRHGTPTGAIAEGTGEGDRVLPLVAQLLGVSREG